MSRRAKKIGPLLDPLRPDEREAVDAAKAAAIETLKPLVRKNPGRTLKSLLPAEFERLVVAAISGWIVARSTQAQLLGVSADKLDAYIRANAPQKDFDDPIPDLGVTQPDELLA